MPTTKANPELAKRFRLTNTLLSFANAEVSVIVMFTESKLMVALPNLSTHITSWSLEVVSELEEELHLDGDDEDEEGTQADDGLEDLKGLEDSGDDEDDEDDEDEVGFEAVTHLLYIDHSVSLEVLKELQALSPPETTEVPEVRIEIAFKADGVKVLRHVFRGRVLPTEEIGATRVDPMIQTLCMECVNVRLNEVLVLPEGAQ